MSHNFTPNWGLRLQNAGYYASKSNFFYNLMAAKIFIKDTVKSTLCSILFHKLDPYATPLLYPWLIMATGDQLVIGGVIT